MSRDSTRVRHRAEPARHGRHLRSGSSIIHTLTQPDMKALDEALAVLEAEDLRLIVRRLIIDISPTTNRRT